MAMQVVLDDEELLQQQQEEEEDAAAGAVQQQQPAWAQGWEYTPVELGTAGAHMRPYLKVMTGAAPLAGCCRRCQRRGWVAMRPSRAEHRVNSLTRDAPNRARPPTNRQPPAGAHGFPVPQPGRVCQDHHADRAGRRRQGHRRCCGPARTPLSAGREARAYPGGGRQAGGQALPPRPRLGLS